MKRFAKLSIVTLIALLLVATTGYTQQTRTFSVAVANICSSEALIINEVRLAIVTQTSTATASATGTVVLNPGQTVIYQPFVFQGLFGQTPSDPNTAEVDGTFQQRAFTASFSPLVFDQALTNTSVAGGCLQITVSEETEDDDDDGGSPTPQPVDPSSPKPITGSETRDQVLATLAAQGFTIDIDGSESNPKLGNVDDPILLRGINPLSVDLVWVSAPGVLRTVITWDNPNVDLDLLVFGITACFQLNGVGLLAELCDRAPNGPVTGGVFAVIVINWSLVPQQYTMSLST